MKDCFKSKMTLFLVPITSLVLLLFFLNYIIVLITQSHLSTAQASSFK